MPFPLQRAEAMNTSTLQIQANGACVSDWSAQRSSAASLRRSIRSRLARIGADPADTNDIRLQKTLLVTFTLLISSLATLWGILYLYFDEPLAASIPLSYAATSLISTIIFALVRRYRLFRFSQLLFCLLLPFLLMLALGGFANSSAVVLWSLTSPLGALVFAGRRQALWWFLAYLCLVAGGIAMEGYVRPSNHLPPAVVTVFFAMNISGTSAVVFIVLHHFVGEKDVAQLLLGKKNRELEKAYHDLKATQAQLIQSEKMASLGQLTAGIAHEIKNPLNFVHNFAELNVQLARELQDELRNNPDARLAAVEDVLEDMDANAGRIARHSRRADAIVQSMMQHARGPTGERALTDINALLDEYVHLAYHGMQAQQAGFEVTVEHDYDDSVGTLAVVPQEIGRVFLNLMNNAFYAMHEKALAMNEPYTPTVTISTRLVKASSDAATSAESVLIGIADNGPGIPSDVKDKIFEPFFTTKPTGSGTGLGLSLAYDIVMQGHGGTLTVESEEGEGATFIITLLATNHQHVPLA